MVKTAAKKFLSRTLWLGRGAATVMGLAMLLALTVGLASTALAGTGVGAHFNLGQTNAVDAVSRLVGSVNGAMLDIENNSPGSRGAPAPALSLNVEQGNPPLSVNPEAGTATGLSADELDGLDQSAFLRSNGKANDADKLDGLDSTQIGINGYEFVRKESAFDSNPFKRASADCPPEKKIVGGGGAVIASLSDPNRDIAPIALRDNGVNLNGLDAYDVSAVEVAPYGSQWKVFAMAVCADVGNP